MTKNRKFEWEAGKTGSLRLLTRHQELAERLNKSQNANKEILLALEKHFGLETEETQALEFKNGSALNGSAEWIVNEFHKTLEPLKKTIENLQAVPMPGIEVVEPPAAAAIKTNEKVKEQSRSVDMHREDVNNPGSVVKHEKPAVQEEIKTDIPASDQESEDDQEEMNQILENLLDF